MRKRSTWIAAVLIWAFSWLLWANATGPPAVADDPNGCFTTGCHRDGGGQFIIDPNSTRLTVTAFPTSYTPDTVYQITIQVSQGVIYGFQAVTQFSSSGAQAGTLSIPPGVTGIAIQSARNLTFINHDQSASSTGTFRINWTAPDSTEQVQLTVFGNAANGNGSNTGDTIIRKILTSTRAQVTLDKQLYFAQFGEGPGLDSLISVTNLSASLAAEGKISFFETLTGNPLILTTTAGTGSSFNFTVQPRGVFNLRANNNGDNTFSIGWVLVESNRELGGTGFFIANFGVAGVAQSKAGRGFITPIEYKNSQGIRTGIALVRPGGGPANVTLRLKDANGAIKATATGLKNPPGPVQLGNNGHFARFFDEFGWDIGDAAIAALLENFTGVIEIQSDVDIAGLLLRFDPNSQLSTLPLDATVP